MLFPDNNDLYFILVIAPGNIHIELLCELATVTCSVTISPLKGSAKTSHLHLTQGLLKCNVRARAQFMVFFRCNLS